MRSSCCVDRQPAPVSVSAVWNTYQRATDRVRQTDMEAGRNRDRKRGGGRQRGRERVLKATGDSL